MAIHLGDVFEFLGYCLMPTHFHFLVRVVAEDCDLAKRRIGLLLSSYTKAVNRRYDRHGSLFQSHTRARQIHDNRDILNTLLYIHQNPMPGKLVCHLEQWEYSSYWDYIYRRGEGLVNSNMIMRMVHSVEELKSMTEFPLLKEEDMIGCY
jgi:REP element-mobilizing transposase RayT